ncbi:glycosyltransferase [Methylobacterium sp. GXF4]|uniref:glycosyltransferase family A protein n=1 Tax=Methylobacterium sp. GXF4 TaxID=1096546 RepID=UPI0002699A52|nr:glycosyltransferase family A protein [Methylobacterium sp. GXF4]EIZ81458.1 glycosyltransferase [Methylobacterium sp. GXF4]
MFNEKITAGIVFHREGYFAVPALKSLKCMIDYARSNGLEIETIAVLDRFDNITKHIVQNCEVAFDDIIEVEFGDLGMSRNAIIDRATGNFVTFFDGDDLWGEEWIVRALTRHKQLSGDKTIILHPEYLFYFDEYDFSAHSTTNYPNDRSKSFWFRHWASDDPRFDPRALLLNNIWSANSFARKEVFQANPYLSVDRNKGFGVEDWAWNIETVWAGALHAIVPEGVHVIRVKQEGSLGKQNVKEGLLLPLPSKFDLSVW